MVQTVFSNTIVERHPAFKQFGSTLQAVSEGVYKKRYKFNNKIKCIDGDKLVGSKDSSVDSVIGIADYEQNRVSRCRLLLVELRMNYFTKEDLHKTKHIGKVAGTLAQLGRNIPVDEKSYFIFNQNFIQKAKRIFSEWRNEGGNTRNFYAYSVDEFNTMIQDEEELSKHYNYKHPVEDLKNELTALIMAANWGALITKMNYLRTEIEVFYNTYKYIEIEPILQAYQDVWPKVKERCPFDDDDTEIEIELIEDFFAPLIKKHLNLQVQENRENA